MRVFFSRLVRENLAQWGKKPEKQLKNPRKWAVLQV
jgi:hypothetical protein